MRKSGCCLLHLPGLQSGHERDASMTRILPHKGPRSRGEGKRSTGRSAADPKKWRGRPWLTKASPPEMFVKLDNPKGWGTRLVHAKIRLRKRCYRYLVWRDGLFKRELYLGKIKFLAPRSPRARGDGGRS